MGVETTNIREGNAGANIAVATDTINGKVYQHVYSAPIYTTKIDEASSTVTYLGKCVPSTADSASLHQISRITISGSITKIEYANGSLEFNAIWNNRALLSYS